MRVQAWGWQCATLFYTHAEWMCSAAPGSAQLVGSVGRCSTGCRRRLHSLLLLASSLPGHQARHSGLLGWRGSPPNTWLGASAWRTTRDGTSEEYRLRAVPAVPAKSTAWIFCASETSKAVHLSSCACRCVQDQGEGWGQVQGWPGLEGEGQAGLEEPAACRCSFSLQVALSTSAKSTAQARRQTAARVTRAAAARAAAAAARVVGHSRGARDPPRSAWTRPDPPRPARIRPNPSGAATALCPCRFSVCWPAAAAKTGSVGGGGGGGGGGRGAGAAGRGAARLFGHSARYANGACPGV